MAVQVGSHPWLGKMPLGLRRKMKTKSKETARLVKGEQAGASGGSLPDPPVPTHKLVFHTQLAHGSATGRVDNFSSIQELYAKIAAVFEISASEVRTRCSGSAWRARALPRAPSVSHVPHRLKLAPAGGAPGC